MIDPNLRRRLSSKLSMRAERTPSSLRASAGRAEFEQIEARLLLDGDHVGLPTPWTPGQGTVVTLNSVSPATDAARGRGNATGTIAAGDAGDLFRFTVPNTPGRTKEFVTVLADTIPGNSTLDTFVEVYDNSGALIATGANNGVLSIGLGGNLAPDGWAGFEADVGSTYYVRVKADPNRAAGRTATGNYTLRVDASVIDLTLNANPNDGPVGVGSLEGALGFRQDDIVYKVTTRTNVLANSLATFQAISLDQTVLNPHIDVFGAQTNKAGLRGFLRQDTDAGRQTDSFLTIRSDQTQTYYVRVRSDDLRAAPSPSQGGFTVQVKTEATVIDIDDQTRLGQSAREVVAALPLTFPPPPAPGAPTAPAGTGANLYTFTAEGTGVGIISVLGVQVGLTPPLPQPAVRFFDDNGISVDFNKGNQFAQLVVPIEGGKTYYLVVEGFDNAADGGIQILIEANHTFDSNQPVDDHINTPGTAGSPDWELATPIRFSDPTQRTDNDGNPLGDRAWIQVGVGTGRLFRGGDTDLFQFTAPVSQQGGFGGDDGNQGSALYVGGNFLSAGTDRRTGATVTRSNVSIWDAGTWWHSGVARQDDPNNPDPAITIDGPFDGPVFALTQWDPDGQGDLPAVLVAGGQFTRIQDKAAQNLAFRVFNPNVGEYVWDTTYGYDALGNPLSPTFGTNGPIFALTTFNVAANVPGDTSETPELIIGGQFTTLNGGANVNNVGAIGVRTDGSGARFLSRIGATGVTGGAGSGVFALAAYDPPAPPSGGGGPTPVDAPAGLYIGGLFNAPTGGSPNLVRWGKADADPATQFAFAGINNTTGVNGTVRSLAVYDSPAQAGNPPADVPARLYIGGSFNGNTVFLQDYDLSRGAAPAPVAGPTGPVLAMAVHRPTTDGQTTGQVPFLAIGGQNNANPANGFVGFIDPNGALAQTFLTNGPVRSLSAFADGGGNQSAEPVYTPGYEVLYAGGDFTTINGNDANHVARFLVGPFGPDWFPMEAGTDGLSDGIAAPTRSSVFALSPFADQVTGQWDRRERAASRVAVNLGSAFDGRFNGLIRVFDSNKNLIYTNDTVAAPFPDPAGALDPSLAPGVQNGLTFEVWGGEVYYVEVSGQGGTGRYNLSVITDSLPPQDGTGQNLAPDGDTNTPAGQGQFPSAVEISTDGQGKGHSFIDPLNAANPAAYTSYQSVITPAGIQILQWQDLPVLSRPSDTHLYFFRAQNDGTAEIRLATEGITSAIQEQRVNVLTNTVVGGFTRAKTFDSPLHGAIRVFNNDFVQLGFADYNQGTSPNSPFVPTQVAQDNPNAVPPDNGLRFFTGNDPRLVINVQRGNVYFIQVESAYKATFNNNPDLVDYRFATGAYDLLLNTTPSLNGVDDHYPDGFDAQFVNGFNGTAIPVNPTTGTGTISGRIQNIPAGPFANPADIDTFSFYSFNRGQTNVTVTPTDPLLSPRVRIVQFDAITGNINIVATVAATPGQNATVNFAVEPGERFFVVVDGVASQGSYIVNVTTPIATDDQQFSDSTFNDTDDTNVGWANAKALQLNRFLGLFGSPGTSGAVGPAQGNIESPIDADIYKFTAESFEFATVNVIAVDPLLDPQVFVYEIGKDGLGQDIFLLIGRNDDIDANNSNSRTVFSVTPGRDYYIVVKGVDPTSDVGRYTVAVNVNATDDHPNTTDFPSGSIINLTFDPNNFTSTGNIAGNIEISTDTDLFRFTAPANGSGTVTLSRGMGSLLALDLVVLNANNAPLAGVTFVTTTTTITATLPSIVQGTQYYLLVRPKAVVPPGDQATGLYSITVNTTPIDDYAPAPGVAPVPGDFTAAPNIALSSLNGVGSITGVLVPTTDSDLFRFDTLAAGAVSVRITTPGSTLNPRVVIFNSSQGQVFSANGNGDSAVVNFNASGIERYYVLVIADPSASGGTAVGSYTVTATSTLPGGGGGGGGPDDFPNAGEFNDSDTNAVIGLDARTGAGAINGIINTSGDTDLFRVNIAGSGFVDIQLNTPPGGLVDGQIKVFNSSRVLVFSDSAGILGATAAVKFSATAGEHYYILVEPVGTATGSYTVRVSTQPTTHFLYFPEGFAGSTIDEFLPIVNPNSFGVDYQVFARYETGDNADVPIFTGSIDANSRGGITITTRNNLSAALVRIGVPYSLEIRSTGPLGATFSHYDFNASVGESFTSKLSTTWTFAEVNKDRNNYRDFVLFYNPGNVTANLNVTLYYQDGGTFTFPVTVDSKRRGGINIDADSRIPRSGRFGMKITSDQPIVSSLSSYNTTRGGGDGLLGDADGGSTRGVVTNVSSGAGVVSNFSILNTNNQAATVTVVADYARTDIPKIIRVITVQPGSQFSLSLTDLGLIPGQTAGLSYSSNIPVTFSATEYQKGDGNTTTTATSAARSYFFGDLFVNPALAGIKYIEQLGLFNPANVPINVTVRFLFADGSPSTTTTLSVAANSFRFTSIDQQPAILGRSGPTAFSLILDSATPFVASLTHYDLFLNGGWSAVGAPIGLTNPLNTLG